MLDIYYDESVVNKVKTEYLKCLNCVKEPPKSFAVSKHEFLELRRAEKAGVKIVVRYNGGTTHIPYRMVR